MNKLLIFGTLRRGQYNFNRFKFYGEQKYIETIRLSGFDLYDLGHYPTVVKGEGEVTFEIHSVCDKILEIITDMEIGAGYKPIKIKVGDSDCTLYTMEKEYIDEGVVRGRPFPKIESGDWVAYQKK